ncbi:MAG: hypothetical protein OEV01_01190 [Nitrospira sp.]|nr:hypothetical protein [Nitrospira sp.]MDH4302439.1 hypothetical protein [Nitrospira sp.]MDH5192558.1 hypothetical protein [Nitrospira sp.]
MSIAQGAPTSERATASGGAVAQSRNCSGGQQQDGSCLPGSTGSPAGAGSTPTPPVTPPVPPSVTPPVVPPAMPPVPFPIVPPSGRPPATQSEDLELPSVIYGWAKATLHIHDDDHDVVYTSDSFPSDPERKHRVKLAFIRRAVQNQRGTTQYVLIPDLGRKMMAWKVNGRVFDCTVEGEAIILFPREQVNALQTAAPGQYTPLDPTRPVFGYLNVVGTDGGDFHSVIIQMFDPNARLTKTCPGDPPMVTEEKFDAGYLLHILWQKNTREDGRVSFKGQQTYDMNKPSGLLDMLPPGENRDIVRQYLNSTETSGTSVRYTWEWEFDTVRPAPEYP